MTLLKLSSTFILTSILVLAVPAHAKNLVPEPVECAGQLFKGKAKYNEELSGVKCFSQSDNQASCFIVADEKKGLQQFTVSQSKTGFLSCMPGPILAKKKGLSCLKGKKAERDFEAIASDDNQLFISGSWGNRRKKSVAPSPERWALISQRRSGGQNISGNCQRVKRKDLISLLKNAGGDIVKFIDTPLQCGGVNLEGLAYQNDKLFFGLRSPSFYSLGGAWVITANAQAIFDGNIKGAKVQRHTLNFKIDGKPVIGAGVRGLEPLGKHQMLVISGPAGVSNEAINEDGQELIRSKCYSKPFYKNAKIAMPFAIWLWTPKTGRLQHLGSVKGQYANHKLESLSIISSNDKKLTLLLAFDGVNNDEMSPLAQLVLELP